MSLFTKPIDAITLTDVEAFCKEGAIESVRVEYKRELSGASDSKQVAKSVSAMANTQGGIILFGVEQENGARGKPKLPLKGMVADHDPAARIEQICLNSIYPPIVPEVQSCALPDGRVVVLVRVHESDETPHSIEGRTRWYVRANDISDPRDATSDELEWLNNRRSKSEAFRTMLLDRCERRFKAMPPKKPGVPEIHILSVPAFPSQELFSLARLSGIMKGEHSLSNDPFTGADLHVVQDGIVFKRWDREKPSDFLTEYMFGQVDRFGTFSYSSWLYEMTRGKSGIILKDLIQKLHSCLSQYASFYKAAGYWGLIDLRLSVLNLNKRGLALETRYTPDIVGGMDFDDRFTYERRIPVDQLTVGLNGLLIDIVQELRWAFNVPSRIGEENYFTDVVARAIAKS